MFLFSFRLKRLPVVLGGVAIALVVVMGVVGLWRTIFPGSIDTATPVNDAGQTEVNVKKASGKTDEDRIQFVEAFGWEVEAEPIEVLEVIIPKEFDEVYERYNILQKSQGFDLTSYAGKRCKRYAYQVTNYPGTDEAVRVQLLVYKNKIIGADVCSELADGFIHGLQMS